MDRTLVIGSDPEFFAGYKKDGKLYVMPPVWFRKYGNIQVKPDIKHPVFIDAMNKYGVLVMEDGVAFELTVKPSTVWEEVFERIQLGKKLLADIVLSRFPDDVEQEVFTHPTIRYELERWDKEDKEFQLCNIFGCDQDRDAGNNDAKGKVVNALKHNKRYGGGHYHLSGRESIKNDPIAAINCQMITGGLATIAFSKNLNLNKMRTFLYGKPEKYRPQEYGKLYNNIPHTDFGVEYRTPSNEWTGSFDMATELFKWAKRGVFDLLETKLGMELYKEIKFDARDAILQANQEKAIQLLAYVESRI